MRPALSWPAVCEGRGAGTVSGQRCAEALAGAGGGSGGGGVEGAMSSHHHHLGPSAPSGEIDHITFLSEHIGGLYLNDEYSDVVLTVEGQRFHGHRVILAARSEYFRAMLYGGLRESQQAEIELKGTSLQAFRGLLKYIYTGHMSLANQKGALRDLISRDSFYAPEADIFHAVADWAQANPDEDAEPVLSAVRLPLILFYLHRAYSYYIEVSINQKDWVRVVDHTRYHCRSWQFLYFAPRVVRFIRIVGTNNTVNKVFHVVTFEAMYTHTPVQLHNGLIVPKENMATAEKSASVIEGVSRSRNALLNGDTKNYDWDLGYTCHQLGSGAILVQLGQPYWLGSMRLLLWDCDERSYSYYVEVSVNMWDWEVVADRTRESCRSWQLLRFPPRPVVYVRIVGTHNTANEVLYWMSAPVLRLKVFHCVHFECPAQVEDPSPTPGTVPSTSTLLEGGDAPASLALPSTSSSAVQSVIKTASSSSSPPPDTAGPTVISKNEPLELAVVCASRRVSEEEGDAVGAVGGVVAVEDNTSGAVVCVADASRPDVALSAGEADRSSSPGFST
ncbi:BTB/POZ domain-containing protein 9 [Gryllus bimaculatus]|nr:BTB/POZ domain-containing protein 9 [Gryllus bimaculatus]